MVEEGQEVSYHRWAEGAGVDCGRGRADEQAAGRILLPREAGGDHRVARQVHCENIHRDGDGLGRSASGSYITLHLHQSPLILMIVSYLT